MLAGCQVAWGKRTVCTLPINRRGSQASELIPEQPAERQSEDSDIPRPWLASERELDGSAECLKLLMKTVVTLILQFAFFANESGSAILLSPHILPWPWLA
ncbi:hypothetical protein Nepgr_020491 [Nepenthes gracilis]|uniref:Uncharacterized protein n=1 Tax=Nepenthes gracilis TaxID=150966 RepID=A0AAD3SVF2_NEPGR|nr:hypothetical protein Nepgr_020491 [Nepenthes gracilis]